MSHLPKFLLMENPLESERVFIYHSQKPRFIAEVDEPDIQVIEWIDQPDLTDPDTSLSLAKLMRKTGDWYNEYTDWEDRNFDPETNLN